MKRKPTKKMKPVAAWALVSENRIVTDGAGGPLVYGKRKEALYDSEPYFRIVRVEIREVKQ